MQKAKTWVGILIVAVLMVCLAGAWYWSQPRLEVGVSGDLSPDDAGEIAQAVQRVFLSRSLPARVEYGFHQLLARAHGETRDRVVIKIAAPPDGTVKAGAALCSGLYGELCRGQRQYVVVRGIDGWQITTEMVPGR